MGRSCSKSLNHPPPSQQFFREELLFEKSGGRAAGCVNFFWLLVHEVMGWYSKYPSHQLSDCNQSGIPVLALSLKLQSSTWVEAREFRYIRLLCIAPEGGPCPILHCCFYLHFPPSLISNCLNLPFGTHGTFKSLKPFSYKREIGVHRKPCIPGRAPPGSAWFHDDCCTSMVSPPRSGDVNTHPCSTKPFSLLLGSEVFHFISEFIVFKCTCLKWPHKYKGLLRS